MFGTRRIINYSIRNVGLFKINTCCIIVLTTKANMRNELDQCADMLSTRCNDIYYQLWRCYECGFVHDVCYSLYQGAVC